VHSSALPQTSASVSMATTPLAPSVCLSRRISKSWELSEHAPIYLNNHEDDGGDQKPNACSTWHLSHTSQSSLTASSSSHHTINPRPVHHNLTKTQLSIQHCQLNHLPLHNTTSPFTAPSQPKAHHNGTKSASSP
jgi:hypothetical protein